MGLQSHNLHQTGKIEECFSNRGVPNLYAIATSAENNVTHIAAKIKS
jgi:hypothetical protein